MTEDGAITGIPEVDNMTPSAAFHAGMRMRGVEVARLRAALEDMIALARGGIEDPTQEAWQRIRDAEELLWVKFVNEQTMQKMKP